MISYKDVRKEEYPHPTLNIHCVGESIVQTGISGIGQILHDSTSSLICQVAEYDDHKESTTVCECVCSRHVYDREL